MDSQVLLRECVLNPDKVQEHYRQSIVVSFIGKSHIEFIRKM